MSDLPDVKIADKTRKVSYNMTVKKSEVIPMEFCENLRRLRTAKRMTQKELAERLGVRRQTIVDWEKPCSIRPDFLNLVGLVTVLDCSWDELMEGEVQRVRQSNPEWDRCKGLVAGLRILSNAIKTVNADIDKKQMEGSSNERNDEYAYNEPECT